MIAEETLVVYVLRYAGVSTIGTPYGPCGYPPGHHGHGHSHSTGNMSFCKLTMELSALLRVCARSCQYASPDIVHLPRCTHASQFGSDKPYSSYGSQVITCALSYFLAVVTLTSELVSTWIMILAVTSITSFVWILMHFSFEPTCKQGSFMTIIATGTVRSALTFLNCWYFNFKADLTSLIVRGSSSTPKQ